MEEKLIEKPEDRTEEQQAQPSDCPHHAWRRRLLLASIVVLGIALVLMALVYYTLYFPYSGWPFWEAVKAYDNTLMAVGSCCTMAGVILLGAALYIERKNEKQEQATETSVTQTE